MAAGQHTVLTVGFRTDAAANPMMSHGLRYLPTPGQVPNALVQLGQLRGEHTRRSRGAEEVEMRDGMRHRRVGDTDPVVVSPLPHLWQRSVMFVVLLVSSGLLLQGAHAADRARPLRIGALTTS